MSRTEHSDYTRAMAAYDARTDDLTDASARPWEPFEEHGRDISDEGWSVVGVRSTGIETALTYDGGRLDHAEEPQIDARLIAAAVNTYEPALTLARLIAERHRPITRSPYASRCLACRTFAPCEEFIAACAVLGVPVTVTPSADDERLPHSRACGMAEHPHGPQCSRDCPTCSGGVPRPTMPDPGKPATGVGL